MLLLMMMDSGRNNDLEAINDHCMDHDDMSSIDKTPPSFCRSSFALFPE